MDFHVNIYFYFTWANSSEIIGIIGLYGKCVSNFLRNKLFSKVAIPFYFPVCKLRVLPITWCYQMGQFTSPSLSSSLPSNKYVVVSHCGLICIALMTLTLGIILFVYILPMYHVHELSLTSFTHFRRGGCFLIFILVEFCVLGTDLLHILQLFSAKI